MFWCPLLLLLMLLCCGAVVLRHSVSVISGRCQLITPVSVTEKSPTGAQHWQHRQQWECMITVTSHWTSPSDHTITPVHHLSTFHHCHHHHHQWQCLHSTSLITEDVLHHPLNHHHHHHLHVQWVLVSMGLLYQVQTFSTSQHQMIRVMREGGHCRTTSDSTPPACHINIW